MDPGSSSNLPDETKTRPRPGPWPPRIEPFVPRTDHNPNELKSWAKRTGFNPNFSGETTISVISEREAEPEPPAGGLDLEKGTERRRPGSPPKAEIEPMLGRRRNNGMEGKGIEIGSRNGGLRTDEKDKKRIGVEPGLGFKEERKQDDVNASVNVNRNRNGNGGGAAIAPAASDEDSKKDGRKFDDEVEINMFSESPEPENPPVYRSPGLKSSLTDKPGYASLIPYGVQHYLSLAGSLVFIPLIMVPAMGGTDEETANVISTMLLVSGITTIMHSFFGTRLPLVQGSSFVYLAPALVVINSEEFRNLSENKFRHIMRELQGAIIIGSVFQTILGYSGLMSLFLRLINPVVVAPTVAAVGWNLSCFIITSKFKAPNSWGSEQGNWLGRIFQHTGWTVEYRHWINNTKNRECAYPGGYKNRQQKSFGSWRCLLDPLLICWKSGCASCIYTTCIGCCCSVLLLGFNFVSWPINIAIHSDSKFNKHTHMLDLHLFISLSIPAYFQQYQPNSSLILPSYFYLMEQHQMDPIHIGNSGLNYALNALLSLNMVVALLVSFLLDNTVPGGKQERGVYIWSNPRSPDMDPSSLEPYLLPKKISCFFGWAKCVGL
ncbi:hypothetical protein J5N97_018605 [Dioscorea zingiberensis]|uniref:Nucleobase-ascorbate transporter 11 n=1 Tax=Dioscorea zingiberensis TaxID=325984 RepID=A0A9D5CCK5_9LILI|nr:hypothetical protein J5N97_018605 [Dioscorea zingiberensis]